MRRIFTLLCISILSLSLVSCGGSDSQRIVSELTVETATDQTSQSIVADFKLEIGQTQLPFLDIPLAKNYGSLRLYTLGGENRVAISLNLTNVFEAPTSPGLLPNGNPIPVDTNGAGVVTIDVDGINARVYVARNGSVTLVGVAFAIDQLDGLGDSIGNIGIFPVFNVGDIQLTAGIFTAPAEKQNGIAMFANLEDLFGIEKNELVLKSDRSVFQAVKQKRISRRKKRRLYKRLRRVMRKDEVLTISEK